MKMAKRKEIEDPLEGFSYPQFKIRRLEPKLPHQNEGVPLPVGDFGNQPTSEMAYAMETVPLSNVTRTTRETVPSPSSIDDRSIVLYAPSDTYLSPGSVPLNPSLLVSPELLQNLKSQVLHQENDHNLDNKFPAGNDSLAVVPWVPSMAAAMASYWSCSQQDQNIKITDVTEELMESEGITSMEVENEPVVPSCNSNLGGKGGSEGFQNQWQLHCMAPGTQPSSNSHLMWSQ